nr:hypothetical protein [Tanacetum cinerariifolium]
MYVNLSMLQEGYIENYKNVSQDIRDQLNAKAKAVQIILIEIDNDIYSTVDAYPNACEMWKAIERWKQGESINVQDLETNLYWKFRKFTSRDVLTSTTTIMKIYKPTNNNLKTSSNTSRANQDNTLRINRGTGYDNQRVVNVAGARENVDAQDAAYHKEKMLLYKQEEVGFQLNAEQADWRDDTDDGPEDQELEAHYMYMAHIQEVTLDSIDNSGPIFDAEPLQKADQDVNDLAKERDLHASLI